MAVFITGNLYILIASPFFTQPPTPSHLATIKMFSVSMSLFLFCSFTYCVFSIPHVSEIIWYLSFSDLFHQAQFPLGPSICHRWQDITPSDMKHLFLIHSSTDGHFCRCHILPVVSIAVRNTGVHADITILDPPKTEVPIWWARQGSSSTFFSHTISMSCFG